MTSYVVIEVTDEDDVENFIRETPHAVCGVYRKPTSFCSCVKEGKRETGPNWLVRGKRFGWWVCKLCHRPPAGMPPAMRNLIEDKRPLNFFLTPYIFKAKTTGDGGFEGWTTPMPMLEFQEEKENEA